MQIVTLTTDFGLGDYEIGSLSGVILDLAPDARVIDLTHDIARHNVRHAAIILERTTPYFPPGTIHMVVVDPGVGTARRPLAARLGNQYFVGPDNGVMTTMLLLAQQANQPVQVVHTNLTQFWRPAISSIFHGRDVFAAVAGHLAAGVPLLSLGDEIDDPVLLEFPRPQQTADGWLGEVTDIDHFGNLGTNLPGGIFTAEHGWSFEINGQHIPRLSATFGEGTPGGLVALIDSSGYLSICIVNGSAERHLAAQAGDEVVVRFNP